MSILIAYNLEKYRKLRKLTQRQLSDKLATVSKSAIALYEKNQRTPSIEIQEHICKTIDIDVEVLNGKNEIDFYTNNLRNELLQYKLNSNEYQYLYRQLLNFFNNNYYFATTSKIDYEKQIKFKNYLSNSITEIEHNIRNTYIGNNDRLDVLFKNVHTIFNMFFALSLTLKNREKNFCPYDVIDIKNFLNYGIDNEFINIFIELKPTYIQILDILNSLDVFQNNSIPVYCGTLNNITDYIMIEPNIKNKKSVLYAIKVSDDFMTPRFDKDDIIITKQCENYITGQYVALTNEDNHILIGKLQLENNIVLLQPLNLKYTPIVLNQQSCKFIGKVVEVRYKN